MENDIIDSITDLGYEGPLLDEIAFAKALEGGPKSLDYTKLIHILAEELKKLCNLEETVNMMNDPDESSSFLLELSSFLKELGCPYKHLTTGHMSSRLQTKEDRLLLLDYLISELMAARMVRVDCPKEKPAGMEIIVQESPTAKDLKEILIALKFNKPPPNITVEMLFTKLEAKLKETIQKEGDKLVGKPLYNKALSEKEWKQLETAYNEMFEEYRLRRETLITRLECTVQSCEWSDRLKNKKDQIQTVYRPKREQMKVKPEVRLSDFLAARTSLLHVEKTSSASVRKNTRSEVNKVIIGQVPDRGGRPNEQQPPPPEMPSWQQRAPGTQGGRGGYNRGGGVGGGVGGGGGGGGGVGRGGSGRGGRVQGSYNQGSGDQRPQTSPGNFNQSQRGYQTFEVPAGGYGNQTGYAQTQGGYGQNQSGYGQNQGGYGGYGGQQGYDSRGGYNKGELGLSQNYMYEPKIVAREQEKTLESSKRKLQSIRHPESHAKTSRMDSNLLNRDFMITPTAKTYDFTKSLEPKRTQPDYVSRISKVSVTWETTEPIRPRTDNKNFITWEPNVENVYRGETVRRSETIDWDLQNEDYKSRNNYVIAENRSYDSRENMYPSIEERNRLELELEWESRSRPSWSTWEEAPKSQREIRWEQAPRSPREIRWEPKEIQFRDATPLDVQNMTILERDKQFDDQFACTGQSVSNFDSRNKDFTRNEDFTRNVDYTRNNYSDSSNMSAVRRMNVKTYVPRDSGNQRNTSRSTVENRHALNQFGEGIMVGQHPTPKSNSFTMWEGIASLYDTGRISYLNRKREYYDSIPEYFSTKRKRYYTLAKKEKTRDDPGAIIEAVDIELRDDTIENVTFEPIIVEKDDDSIISIHSSPSRSEVETDLVIENNQTQKLQNKIQSRTLHGLADKSSVNNDSLQQSHRAFEIAVSTTEQSINDTIIIEDDDDPVIVVPSNTSKDTDDAQTKDMPQYINVETLEVEGETKDSCLQTHFMSFTKPLKPDTKIAMEDCLKENSSMLAQIELRDLEASEKSEADEISGQSVSSTVLRGSSRDTSTQCVIMGEEHNRRRRFSLIKSKILAKSGREIINSTGSAKAFIIYGKFNEPTVNLKKDFKKMDEAYSKSITKSDTEQLNIVETSNFNVQKEISNVEGKTTQKDHEIKKNGPIRKQETITKVLKDVCLQTHFANTNKYLKPHVRTIIENELKKGIQVVQDIIKRDFEARTKSELDEVLDRSISSMMIRDGSRDVCAQCVLINVDANFMRQVSLIKSKEIAKNIRKVINETGSAKDAIMLDVYREPNCARLDRKKNKKGKTDTFENVINEVADEMNLNNESINTEDLGIDRPSTSEESLIINCKPKVIVKRSRDVCLQAHLCSYKNTIKLQAKKLMDAVFNQNVSIFREMQKREEEVYQNSEEDEALNRSISSIMLNEGSRDISVQCMLIDNTMRTKRMHALIQSKMTSKIIRETIKKTGTAKEAMSYSLTEDPVPKDRKKNARKNDVIAKPQEVQLHKSWSQWSLNKKK